jgi:hypothetical protein
MTNWQVVGVVGGGLLCAFLAFRTVRLFRGRSDARRAVDKGLFGPKITEGLVSEEEIAGDYDAKLTQLWGGPKIAYFNDAFSSWPDTYESGQGQASPHSRSVRIRAGFERREVTIGLSQVALVTGGSAGIGFYVSKLLARLGYTVVIPFRQGLEFEVSGAKRAIQQSVGKCEVRSILRVMLYVAWHVSYCRSLFRACLSTSAPSSPSEPLRKSSLRSWPGAVPGCLCCVSTRAVAGQEAIRTR